MKCPHCNAASEVLETRAAGRGMMRRRRLCFNEHPFSTYEVCIDIDPLAKTKRAREAATRAGASELRSALARVREVARCESEVVLNKPPRAAH